MTRRARCRSYCGWLVWVPAATAVGVAVACGSRWYSNSQGMSGAPLPWILWVWFGLASASVVVAAVGWTFGRHWQQAVAVAAVLVSLLSAGAVLNQYTGYVRTVKQAYAEAVDSPLPGEVPLGSLQGMRGHVPASGALVRIHAPVPRSDFAHRDEVVYLPPAWFAGDHPPELPAVMLVGAAFNTPEDWVRNGHADAVADRYAAAHGGRAPVLVLADVSGSMGNDTECVDGPRGRSATYATDDLPSYVESAFGTRRDPGGWAIAGWSMGGTCAIGLTAAYPDRFHTFLDIAGDLTPNAGTAQATLERLYGGDTAARDRFDPVTAMRAHGRYPGVAGVFVDGVRTGGTGGLGGLADQMIGDDSAPQGPEPSSILCPEARRHGIGCEVVDSGLPHQWQLAEQEFRGHFDWLAGRLGTV